MYNYIHIKLGTTTRVHVIVFTVAVNNGTIGKKRIVVTELDLWKRRVDKQVKLHILLS